ncbi:MAG TPA: hypothetical protein VNE60_12050 [Gemmatimonadaceae bacterium]|nr:hypothetical protein [Gemmatimonadaceae bacterium]
MKPSIAELAHAGALAIAGATLVAACGGSTGKSAAARADSAVQAPAGEAALQAPCPADGRWKECSVLDRLIRAGLGVRRDSAAAHEPGVATPGVLYHVGSATLALYFFPDSAARKAAVAALDTTQFVGYNDPQTIRAERSLIQSANLLALLDSRRDEQRERIGDAITAGPPQPVPPKR